jgi:hypothetical protein
MIRYGKLLKAYELVCHLQKNPTKDNFVEIFSVPLIGLTSNSYIPTLFFRQKDIIPNERDVYLLEQFTNISSYNDMISSYLILKMGDEEDECKVSFFTQYELTNKTNEYANFNCKISSLPIQLIINYLLRKWEQEHIFRGRNGEQIWEVII